MTQEPIIFFHLKLVAKISLAVGALAVLALLAVLTLITGEQGQSYGALIQSHSLTRNYLGVAMLAAGLILVAIAGFITWSIVLYSSFRVAGPLYRFGQNMKLAGASNAAELVALRKGDALSAQATSLREAVATLRRHYVDMTAAADAAACALHAGDGAQYAEVVARLKGLDEKVRV